MIKYLTLEEVLEMHDAFIEKFGGLKGVRDVNLLLSAIYRNTKGCNVWR